MERRREARYPAVDNVSKVAWWVEDHLCMTDAQLMDVSRSGLLVLADDAPPAGGTLLVRLVEPSPSPWIEAQLVEAHLTRHGPYQLRLTFRGTPPEGFVTDAINRPLEDETL
ncbi:PilZ domain-containing protein [Singulisphaera rosea]